MSMYSLVWDLDSIFEGGSASSQLQQGIEDVQRSLSKLKSAVERLQGNSSVLEWYSVLSDMQQIGSRYSEIDSFVGCLLAQSVKDEKAKLLQGSIIQIGADYESVTNAVEQKIASISEKDWTRLKQSSELSPLSFSLGEMRKHASERLPLEQEALIGDLSIDGYHGWSEMYNTIVGKMQVAVEEGDETKIVSMGQLSNKMFNPNREIRTQLFKKWEEAWKSQAELFATVLNHISGYRLQLYKHRKWECVLKEPLAQNRMKEKTLQTMWSVIAKEKHRLLPYMERKAKILGIPRLNWVDVHAPLPGEVKVVSYDEGAQFIIDQFQRFDPKMAEFAKMSFEKRWIEAEDRPGKRPGGFMTSLPVSQESRIFMTYSGTPRCISTLAHELGHAYHTYVMRDLPLLSQQYAMNVAETASTFAEMIVRDASIKNASSKEEKISLMADKVESGISFMMDIHARFLFESRLYSARRKSPLGVDELCTLMVEAQKEGFAYSLDGYDPTFWASKLHFYGTDVPFYNFPYSFGFLFSAGIYAQAQKEGDNFAQKYVDLLRDTARMNVEELASQHLGVDLTEESFWKSAVDVALEDIDEFLSLTS